MYQRGDLCSIPYPHYTYLVVRVQHPIYSTFLEIEKHQFPDAFLYTRLRFVMYPWESRGPHK